MFSLTFINRNANIITLKCKECNNIFKYSFTGLNGLLQKYQENFCPLCTREYKHQTTTSNLEKEFQDYINSITTNYEIYKNNRTILEGKELEELYSNAYVYCLPSDLEGMPLSLLEAMSYKNCCLTSDIPECAEVLEDMGIIFKKGNVKLLTKKLQELVDDEEKVKVYKKGAQKFILDKYNWDEVTKKTLELYEK